MKREFQFSAGSGISVTPVDNADGTQTVTVANTSPGIATPVSVSNGGTGDTSLAAHDVLVGNGTSPITAVSPGAFGLVLTSHGTLADPSFDQIDLAGSLTQLANALPVPHGGTGVATLTAHTVLVGAGTGTVVQVGPGSSGQVLTSNGAADPSFQALPTAPSVVAGAGIQVTGSPAYTVAISGATAHSLFVTTGSPGFSTIAPGTSGTYLRSNGASSDPSYQAPVVSAYGASPGNTVTVSNSIVVVTSTSVTTTASQWIVVWASFFLDYNRTSTADTFTFGIGVDTSAAFTESRVTECPSITGNPIGITPTTMFRVQPGAGSHTINALCKLGSAGAQAVDADLIVMVVDN